MTGFVVPPVPLVTLHGARPRNMGGATASLDFILGAGLHAIVGTPDDGTLAIAGQVSGLEPRSAGDVSVRGGDPWRDPAVRRSIGATFLKSHLPTMGRVGALLAQIDGLRGGDHASRGLARLGLAQWHDRKLVTMSPRELRALELVVAVSTPAPAALVLTEPGADIAPLDWQGLRESLLEARAAGACVIVVTASMSDAVELTETLHLFERGRIVRWVPADQMGALVPGRGIELRVEVDYPRLIVAPLTDDPDVTGIGWDQEGRKSVLSVRGEDVDCVALAVARAALATGTNVRAIAPVARVSTKFAPPPQGSR